MSRRAALFLVTVLLVAPIARATGESPPGGDVAAALERLGPPGFLWGRIAVEEESPEGAWTPLAGVEITVFPYAPAVAGELERIRRSARDALSQYETAVARLQELLRRQRAEIDAARRDLAAVTAGEEGLVRRRVTDPAGVFVFEDLPSGEWLLVAVRVTSATAGRDGIDARRPSRPGAQRFLTRPDTGPVRTAEVWVARVRITAGERARVALSDRGRFLAGPLRGEVQR